MCALCPREREIGDSGGNSHGFASFWRGIIYFAVFLGRSGSGLVSGTRRERLLEREEELDVLREVFAAAVSGHGRAVLIEGPAGTGKSSLADAACLLARRAGLRVLRARGSELEHEFPFGIVHQLFEPVLAAAQPPERDRLLDGAARAAEWVLAPDLVSPRDRGAARFAVLNGIYWLAANLSTKQPLVCVLDDVHWADASSLRAVNFLAARISDLPIAIIAALRSAEPGAPSELLDSLRTHPGVVHLGLGPLRPDSVEQIVREQVPSANAEMCAAFCEMSAANPLYLQELLRSLAGNGLLRHPRPEELIRTASVPSLGDRVVRRIARVAPDGPGLATAMAVLGDGARLEVAAQLAGLDLTAAGKIAQRLRQIEVLAAEDPFAFVHPLVRRTLYDHLSERERQDLHAAAAELLGEDGHQVEAVAAHIAALPPNRSATAAATLLAAGRQALAQAAPDEAVQWFRRALEEDAAEPPAAVILAELGMTEVILSDPAAIGHLQEALALAKDRALETRISVTLAEILGQLGQWQAATAMTARAEALVAGAGPELEAEAAAVKAVLTVYDPEGVAEFERERPRFRTLAGGEGWAAHALAATLAAAAACRGEDAGAVLALADRALEGGRLLGERGAGAWASAQLLGALVCVEAYERAEAAIELVLQASQRDGTVIGSFTAMGFRGWVHSMRGDLAAAELDLTTAFHQAEDAGLTMAGATGLFFLQDAMLERPTLEWAADLAERTVLDPIFDRTWSGGMVRQARARARLARRDFEGAVTDLRAVGEVAKALRIGPAFSLWRSVLALALPADQREEARQLVAEELELARAAGLRRATGASLRAAGILEGGARGVELLRESVSVLEASPARYEYARSIVELGSVLRRSHRRREARPYLGTGMELAHTCGAERLLARTREELRAAGGRPRRIARSGRDALTASELRIALLAAEGATNSQIGQELYISLKTVETHLSHVYTKLSLSGQGSRQRLAGALGRNIPPLGAPG
jgi:DNA-binding CsgD family transcriptional regulator